MEREVHISGLGITASHVRRIKSGAEYEKYFPSPTGKTEVVKENATVHDTLAFVKVLVNDTLIDTVKIAPVLKRSTLAGTCKAVFDFFYQHYQYKLDEYGIEQVRRPSRAWADRRTGIDCDCFSASVSSVLTNLGIAHYLKIIAINGRDNYQHIYVVVPKNIDLNINQRANYWVIDPVLNHFDEEAPSITKTKTLKMEGIPLHQLNGVDDATETYGGLGNEFETIDGLEGLSDEDLGRAYIRRLGAHIRNTRRKIEADPKSVATLYKPQVLVHQLRTLEGALSGTDEQLEATLAHLSAVEHEAIQPAFAGMYDELHGHDDELYGALFGAIDDNMLDGVSGLGKKGRAAARATKGAAKKAAQKAGKAPGKTGFFTKVKNATKSVKAAAKSGKMKGKLKTAIKKVGRVLKKTNPLAMAARGGFIMAMRTNFGKIAEKAWWGYQTWQYAKSKGISEAYYKSCVELLNKIKRVYIDRLGGNESAIKKPIMNGRAAKKIAKAAKKKGMSGLSALYGLDGLGVAAAAASATTITAAMAFITPILTWIKKAFAGKKGGVMNENGTESDAPSENAAEEMDNTSAEASSPSDTLIDNDNSVEQADAANDEPPSDDAGQKKNRSIASDQGADGGKDQSDQSKQSDEGSVKPGEGRGPSTAETAKSSTGLAIGVAAVAAVAIGVGVAKSKKKQDKKQEPVAGLEGAKTPPKKAPVKKVKIVKL